MNLHVVNKENESEENEEDNLDYYVQLITVPGHNPIECRTNHIICKRKKIATRLELILIVFSKTFKIDLHIQTLKSTQI